nr:DapH/DapD/GlmU-related protein [Sphingobacterium sp. CFCC 11742]
MASRNSETILNYYRKKGCSIGKGTVAIDSKSIVIDVTRPSLVTIGDNVLLHRGIKILTHDYSSRVFLNLYHEFVPSHGRVTIGNNVWFGENCTVLKSVSIGDNCIIGYGSLVTKDIPANSVAVGIPARVICSIGDYYKKRRKQYVEEVIDYAISIRDRYKRAPVLEDFVDDFPSFINGENYKDYPMFPVQQRLKDNFELWRLNHVSEFKNFEEFIKEVERRS